MCVCVCVCVCVHARVRAHAHACMREIEREGRRGERSERGGEEESFVTARSAVSAQPASQPASQPTRPPVLLLVT